METEGILDAIGEYHVSMEEKLQSVVIEAKKKLEERIAGLPEDDQGNDAIFEIEEFNWTYKFMYPLSLRYSFIVLLFIALEDRLNAFCDELQNRMSLRLRSKDLKGDLVKRSRTYVEKLAGVTSIDRAAWDNLEDLSKVRNCIVHTFGDVASSSDRIRLEDLVARGIGLSLDTSEADKTKLVVSHDYCVMAAIDVDRFFVSACAGLP